MLPVLDARAKHTNWRWIVAAAAVITALAHLPVIEPHLAEAPYMGMLFIALTIACLACACAVLVRDVPAVYGAAILTHALPIIGYAATRVVAFPQLASDVGNWLEPLGILSVAAEAVVVLAAFHALRRPNAGLTVGPASAPS